MAVINRREAKRGKSGGSEASEETVIESRAARAFRRIAGRRVFHEAPIKPAFIAFVASLPLIPLPPRVSALSGRVSA